MEGSWTKRLPVGRNVQDPLRAAGFRDAAILAPGVRDGAPGERAPLDAVRGRALTASLRRDVSAFGRFLADGGAPGL